MVAAWLFCLAFQEQTPSGDHEPLQVRFLHEGRCGDQPCPKERHWKILAGDRVPGDAEDFGEAIQKEADAQRAGAPRPELSERIVFFGGDRSVPWGTLIWAMRRCADAGIYKMAWLKPGDEKAEMAHKFLLQDPVKDERCLLANPRISLRWDAGLVRRVGIQAPAVTMDALMASLREEISTLKKSGKTEGGPLEIDAGADVPWKHVIEVMDRCRNDGFEALEIVPLLRRKVASKK